MFHDVTNPFISFMHSSQKSGIFKSGRPLLTVGTPTSVPCVSHTTTNGLPGPQSSPWSGAKYITTHPLLMMLCREQMYPALTLYGFRLLMVHPNLYLPRSMRTMAPVATNPFTWEYTDCDTRACRMPARSRDAMMCGSKSRTVK